ncbi:MAG: methyltransferase domain-containing protein [Rhizobiaceae bacterium]
MPDVFQSIDEMEADKQSMIAQRLENRAEMPKFAAVRDAYFEVIDLPSASHVLELGCGTGAVCRAIARWPGFRGEVVGSDLSQSLVESAKQLTEESGVEGVTFLQADGQGSTQHQGEFDLVLGHTVISHVADPDAFLKEAIRLTRRGGRVVIHDGDYASMTFNTGAPDFDTTLPPKYFDAIIANPFVMREMPARLKRLVVNTVDAIGAMVLEAGTGEYFPSLIRNYAPIAVAAGTVKEDEAAGWISALDRSLADGSFFGSCNFITYVFEKQS